MRVDEESGDDIKAFLSHSVMIQREWSSKELLSFPLWRQKEKDVRENDIWRERNEQ